MTKSPLLSLIIFIFLAAPSVFSQKVQDVVNFQISFHENKTVYRIGEPIRLKLSFTASKPGFAVQRYNWPLYDDVILSPNDVDYTWNFKRLRSGSFVYDVVVLKKKLSQSPVTVDLTLNDRFRFDKPRKYRVKVVSSRVWGANDSSSSNSFLSNEIKFEIKEMTEAEERVIVKRLAASMDSAKTSDEYFKSKRDLNYLRGNASTVEKVKRIFNLPVFYGSSYSDGGVGLATVKNKKLALKLLEEAFQDPDQTINKELIGIIAWHRLSVEAPHLLKRAIDPVKFFDPIKFFKYVKPRLSELEGFYYRELFNSLSKRKGKSLTSAAFTVFVSHPENDLSNAAYEKVRKILLEKFDELHRTVQANLLADHWDKIKAPSLTPSLIKILAKRESSLWLGHRGIALKRLIEIDERVARPFVIRELRDPRSFIQLENLKTLSDQFLPEVDGAFLEQIENLAAAKKKGNEFRFKLIFLRVARYATNKIYPDLLKLYKKYEKGWSDEMCAALFAYLVRVNDKETSSLIAKRLAKDSGTDLSTIFRRFARTKTISKGMEKLLRKYLESDEPHIVRSAAYFLSKRPNKKNRELVRKRYDRWLKEWGRRVAEMENPNSDEEVRAQLWVQPNLIRLLVNTTRWKLSRNEFFNLKLSCVTEKCRQDLKRLVFRQN